jgi:hypothetical protein
MAADEYDLIDNNSIQLQYLGLGGRNTEYRHDRKALARWL